MAIVRTVLPRKGLIQSQHGGVQYEQDQDTNLSVLDANVAFMSDLTGGLTSVLGLGLNGVVLTSTPGFVLSTSASLVPGLTAGLLYAQGVAYSPSGSPTVPAAPASATNYLFYNSSMGFYYQTSPVAATAGDALIGKVTTSGSAVTAVVQGTPIYGTIALAPGAAGNFTIPHLLGRPPVGISLRNTSPTLIWFQSPTDLDGTNLYLAASDPSATAKVQVW